MEIIYQIYLEKGENDRAIQALEKYVDRFPDTPSSYLFRYWIAKIEEDRGNFDKSLELLYQIANSYSLDAEDPYDLKIDS